MSGGMTTVTRFREASWQQHLAYLDTCCEPNRTGVVLVALSVSGNTFLQFDSSEVLNAVIARIAIDVHNSFIDWVFSVEKFPGNTSNLSSCFPYANLHCPS